MVFYHLILKVTDKIYEDITDFRPLIVSHPHGCSHPYSKPSQTLIYKPQSERSLSKSSENISEHTQFGIATLFGKGHWFNSRRYLSF